VDAVLGIGSNVKGKIRGFIFNGARFYFKLDWLEWAVPSIVFSCFSFDFYFLFFIFFGAVPAMRFYLLRLTPV